MNDFGLRCCDSVDCDGDSGESLGANCNEEDSNAGKGSSWLGEHNVDNGDSDEYWWLLLRY